MNSIIERFIDTSPEKITIKVKTGENLIGNDYVYIAPENMMYRVEGKCCRVKMNDWRTGKDLIRGINISGPKSSGETVTIQLSGDVPYSGGTIGEQYLSDIYPGQVRELPITEHYVGVNKGSEIKITDNINSKIYDKYKYNFNHYPVSSYTKGYLAGGVLGTNDPDSGVWGCGYLTNKIDKFVNDESITRISGVLPTPKMMSSGSSIGDQAYFAAGVNSSTNGTTDITKINSLDDTVKQCSYSLTNGVLVSSASNLSHSMYIFGGCSNVAGATTYDNIERINNENVGSLLSITLSTPKNNLTSSTLRGQIFTGGGYNGTSNLDSIEKLTSDTYITTVTAVLTNLRRYLGSARLENRILFASGFESGFVKKIDGLTDDYTCIRLHTLLNSGGLNYGLEITDSAYFGYLYSSSWEFYQATSFYIEKVIRDLSCNFISASLTKSAGSSASV